MRVPLLSALVASTESTFGTLLNCAARRNDLNLSDGLSNEVSGIIGLTGMVNGLVAVSLSRQLALHAASTFLMEEFQEINDDVMDVAGELANNIVGSAKSKLESGSISITVPTVVVGSDHRFRFPDRALPIRIPFFTDFGPFALEVGLVDNWQPDEEDAEIIREVRREPYFEAFTDFRI